MSGIPWSDEDVAVVRGLYLGGETDAVIAAAVGRTVPSVMSLRAARRILRPRETMKRAPEWSAAELERATRMYAEGWPNAMIATATGRTRIAIKRFVTGRALRRDATMVPDARQFSTVAEEWRPCAGKPYAVSSVGRVMSLVPGNLGRILRPWVDQWGYSHVTMQLVGATKRHAVHRLMALAFLGEPPAGCQVAHNDGNPRNNTVANLRWATAKENQADRLLHGTAHRTTKGKFLARARKAGVPVQEVPK